MSSRTPIPTDVDSRPQFPSADSVCAGADTSWSSFDAAGISGIDSVAGPAMDHVSCSQPAALGALGGGADGPGIRDLVGRRQGKQTAARPVPQRGPLRLTRQMSAPTPRSNGADSSQFDWTKPFEATQGTSSKEYIQHFERMINEGVTELQDTPAIFTHAVVVENPQRTLCGRLTSKGRRIGAGVGGVSGVVAGVTVGAIFGSALPGVGTIVGGLLGGLVGGLLVGAGGAAIGHGIGHAVACSREREPTPGSPTRVEKLAGVYKKGAVADFGRATYIVCGRYVSHEMPQKLNREGWFSKEQAAARFVEALNDPTHALPLSSVLHQGIYADGVRSFLEASGERSYAGVAGCGIPVLEQPTSETKGTSDIEAETRKEIQAAESRRDHKAAKNLARKLFDDSATGVCYEVIADRKNPDRYRFQVTLKKRITALQVANRRGAEKNASRMITADPANSSLLAILTGTFDAADPDRPVQLDKNSLCIQIKYAPLPDGA